MRVTVLIGIWFLTAMWFTGCDTQIEVSQTGLINGAEYVPIEDKADPNDRQKVTLDISSPSQISGSGKVSFNYPMTGGPESKQQFDLSFTLEGNDSAVTLYTFSKSHLLFGVELVIKREEDVLKGFYRIRGAVAELPKDTFAGISLEGELTFRVFVENFERHASLQLLDEEGNQIFTSESTKVGGVGESVYWGVGLTKAVVTQAENHPLSGPSDAE